MVHDSIGIHVLETRTQAGLRLSAYEIEADVRIDERAEGVLVAHGDATSGYSLYGSAACIMS